MTLNVMMARLAEEAGVREGYPADEDGVVRLVFDDGFFVGLMEVEEEGVILLWSPVAKLPQTGGAGLPLELLKANHFGRASAGGTLSLSDDGVVFLHGLLPLAGLEYEAFRRRLEGLVGAAAQWRQVIESCRDGIADVAVRQRSIDEPRRTEGDGFIRA